MITKEEALRQMEELVVEYREAQNMIMSRKVLGLITKLNRIAHRQDALVTTIKESYPDPNDLAYLEMKDNFMRVLEEAKQTEHLAKAAVGLGGFRMGVNK